MNISSTQSIISNNSHFYQHLSPSNETFRRSSLFSFVDDQHLPYLIPALVYWLIGLTFHVFDLKGWFQSYKVHTPAEFLSKNRASRQSVICYALLQQTAQCIIGYVRARPTALVHSHEYHTAMWVQKMRLGGKLVPVTLRAMGINNIELGERVLKYSPSLSSVISSGMIYSCGYDISSGGCQPPYARWELFLAQLVYWVIVPGLQYGTALFLADTWQYFTHRLLHMNKFLYKHIHQLHHDIYVNFAYGAFYNHPLETIPIDGIGFPICLALAGLDERQSTVFGTMWTVKTVVDHCGYMFPYDPCNLLCRNSQLFHDLHHQSWGMKHNFSVYTPFWDHVLGTYWPADDMKAQEKYFRGRKNAELKIERQLSKNLYQGGLDVVKGCEL